TYTTTIGGSTSMFMGNQADTNEANLSVPLKAGADAKTTAQRIREAIAALGDGVGEVEVSVGSSMGTSGVVVYVESPDSASLEVANKQVLTMMEGIPGLTNVSSDIVDDRDMLSVNVDEQKASDLGMTQASIGQAVARSVRGQLIGTLTSGDTTVNVYLRSQSPVKSVEELREIKLPVTQRMNADAKSGAADKVSQWSDRFSADSKQQSTDAYNDQVKALKKSKASAQKAVAKLNAQLSAAKKNLASLQDQLQKAQQNPNPSDPAVSVTVFQLTQQISAMANQVAQLSSAVASSQAGVTSVDKQLDSLAESRTSSLDAQAEQEAIADASQDAADATAEPIRLTEVATVDVVQAPASITRVNGSRAATLTASSEASDLGGTTSLINQGIASLDLPDGVTVRVGGVSQQQSDSFAQLGLAMVIAIAVVYLIMVATFGSLLQPLILLISIPFAATGALGLSRLTDTPLGIASMIGLLMLIGIVVTNAIVLIDLINQKRRAGASVVESIQAGARLRVRPIVMTALATVFALIPMSLGLTGGGVFISKPLAIVVIGGLVSSTLLTLILVPVLYGLLETWRENRRERRRHSAQEGESVPA
ncbi:MAG TPA: multidrug transporter, partial [Propionibacteriaceae bacterium]|nr:multidrug transporter [Propionibacteriaceae bacterium]